MKEQSKYARLRQDSEVIIRESIKAVLPDAAVYKTLGDLELGKGRVVLVSVGKAGWQMAKAAYDVYTDRIDAGVVITKYEHVKGKIGDFQLFEAGHPVPDGNSYRGTEAAIELVTDLTEEDTVLFLLSGGGSALFEKPLIPPKDLATVTRELLESGADIKSVNTIRKRFSAVKGGRFACLCAPAQVVSIVLSDIIGDPLDMIASGPAYPDSSTTQDALYIADRYNLTLTDEMRHLLYEETPKEISNVRTYITGSVRELTRAAAKAAEDLGYRPIILTDSLACEAREAGSFLASIARTHADTAESLAFIAGGETVVHVRGKGKGGRNQEIVISGAIGIAGLETTAIFSIGSDGTDGPTDAAGGYADSSTVGCCSSGGRVSVEDVQRALDDNDAYPLLRQMDGLIITGATGTNVNDLTVVLIKR